MGRQMMQWRKLKHIFCADNHSEFMHSYARLPIADKIDDNTFDIYFAARDTSVRERVFKLTFDMDTLSILEIQPEPVLNYGETLGAFDENGVAPCAIVTVDNKKYLYYGGWQKQVNTPFSCAVGIAQSHDNGKTFDKMFKGAVLDRDKNDHLFVAVNDVIIEKGTFKTWYLSCVNWQEQGEGELLHYYHINYAESDNGIDWIKHKGENAITFKNEFEYAISTPRVIKEADNLYKMWYSYRAQKNIETYRIGYAESTDGRQWQRKDEQMYSLDVSEMGWDSEMICYPYLFTHNDKLYMLYNGNGYGKTGFGIAVLEQF